MRLTYFRRLIRFAFLAIAGGAASLVAQTAGEAAAPLPAETTVEINGVAMAFVLIPAGSFAMGASEYVGDGDESPVHRVTISRPYYLGKYEVTQAQWQAAMGENPSHVRGPQLPVESVTWHDCQRFLGRLAEKTGRTFALPTEAQWEYACRAGTTTSWSFGADDTLAGDHAWFRANSGGVTHPVGTKAPNAWGLYDMHGNVGEWCADYYLKHAYADGDVTDPQQARAAPDSSPVWRGGAWGDGTDYLRSSYRNVNGPDNPHAGIGLRCVMVVPVAAR